MSHYMLLLFGYLLDTSLRRQDELDPTLGRRGHLARCVPPEKWRSLFHVINPLLFIVQLRWLDIGFVFFFPKDVNKYLANVLLIT